MELCLLPFITEAGNKYCYDRKTGVTLPLNDILQEGLEKMVDNELVEVREILRGKYAGEKNLVDGCLDFIRRWQENFGGFFLNQGELQEIKFNIRNYDERTLQEFFNYGNRYQLILNVTEDCNMRCKYCFLSEVYNFTRCRTEKKMTLETGKRAIDQFLWGLQHVADFNPGKRVVITFYGGEPLLEFSLVKRLVEYARSIAKMPISFNMTTNGTLLQEHMMDFIVENEIYLAVSLDGNRENNDRNRVFPSGEGTYDLVCGNLQKFREKYPDYHGVSIISVFDWQTDLEANDEFFSQSDLPAVAFTSGAATFNTSYYDQFSQEDIARHSKQFSRLWQKYIHYKKEGQEISSYLRCLIEGQLSPILIRPRHEDVRAPMVPFTNTCVPGMKVSVRAHGEYDMCERVNETMPIGCLEKGVNLEKIKKIIDNFNETVGKDCWSCPINNICNFCFAMCMGDGKFQLPISCEESRNNFSQYFSVVNSILEENPKAYDDFDINVEWFFYG